MPNLDRVIEFIHLKKGMKWKTLNLLADGSNPEAQRLIVLRDHIGFDYTVKKEKETTKWTALATKFELISIELGWDIDDAKRRPDYRAIKAAPLDPVRVDRQQKITMYLDYRYGRQLTYLNKKDIPYEGPFFSAMDKLNLDFKLVTVMYIRLLRDRSLRSRFSDLIDTIASALGQMKNDPDSTTTINNIAKTIHSFYVDEQLAQRMHMAKDEFPTLDLVFFSYILLLSAKLTPLVLRVFGDQAFNLFVKPLTKKLKED